VIKLSKELNNLLKEAYYRWLDDTNPPIPLKTIKQYLELDGEGVDE